MTGNTEPKATTQGPKEIVTAACTIINSIDAAANADPDTLLRVRRTDTHIVLITHRGQKFSVPIGTANAAAEAQADAQADSQPQPVPEAEPEPEPNNTSKHGPPQPANTVKRSSSQLPGKTTKRTARK